MRFLKVRFASYWDPEIRIYKHTINIKLGKTRPRTVYMWFWFQSATCTVSFAGCHVLGSVYTRPGEERAHAMDTHTQWTSPSSVTVIAFLRTLSAVRSFRHTLTVILFIGGWTFPHEDGNQCGILQDCGYLRTSSTEGKNEKLFQFLF